MANTQGFQFVVETTRSFLNEILQAAWKSGGWSPGHPQPMGSMGQSIPNPINIPIVVGGFSIGDLTVTIQVPSIEKLIPPNQVDISIPFIADAQLQVLNLPSLQLFHLFGNVQVTAGIENVSTTATPQVVINLKNLTQNDVIVTLSVDPITSNLSRIMGDYINQLYDKGTLPQIDPQGGQLMQNLQYKGEDAYVVQETFVFLNGPAPTPLIEIEILSGTTILQISLPFQLFINQVTPLDQLAPMFLPMACSGLIQLSTPLNSSPEGYSVNLVMPPTTLSVVVDPPPGSRSSYATNQASLGVADLQSTLHSTILAEAVRLSAAASSAGANAFPAPTKLQIEQMLAHQLLLWLQKQQEIILWPPQSGALPDGINGLDIRVVPEALVLAINPEGPGANAGAITNFIPSGSPVGSFAAALDSTEAQAVFSAALKSLGGVPFTTTADGHDVTVHSLSMSLGDGVMTVSGDLTVYRVTIFNFDIDASFTVPVTLAWGRQGLVGSANITDPLLYGAGGRLAGRTLVLNVGGAGDATLVFDSAGVINDSAMFAAISAKWPSLTASLDPDAKKLLLITAPYGVTIVAGVGTANTVLGLSINQFSGAELTFQSGTPDVTVHTTHIGVIGLIVSIVIGIVTGGAFGALIAALVVEVVNFISQAIAARIGTGLSSGIPSLFNVAWPEDLLNIVRVNAQFQNPIYVTTDGFLFWGE